MKTSHVNNVCTCKYPCPISVSERDHRYLATANLGGGGGGGGVVSKMIVLYGE